MSDEDTNDDTGESTGKTGEQLNRRELLQIGVGASLASSLAGLAPAAPTLAAAAQALAAGLFFTAAEMALLDELTEMMIPADEHSGGARAAGVAAFIDRTLSQKDPKIEDYAEERQRFKDGLARVDELARSLHDASFLDGSREQRTAVLTRMARNEAAPETPEEKFFGELKRTTAFAYYSSEVGIHDEMQYKGNTLLRRFVGTDVSTG